jgi:thioredoxin-like negative regulator of GroEL
MKDGITQEEVEWLLGRRPDFEGGSPPPSLAAIYFTAGWCSACKKLDLPAVTAALPEAAWYRCDVDVNTYTSGYCGVRSLPSFLIIRDGKPIGPLGSSVTERVLRWLQETSGAK